MFGDKEVAELRLLYFLRFQKIPPSRYLLGQPGWRVVVVYRLLVVCIVLYFYLCFTNYSSQKSKQHQIQASYTSSILDL